VASRSSPSRGVQPPRRPGALRRVKRVGHRQLARHRRFHVKRRPEGEDPSEVQRMARCSQKGSRSPGPAAVGPSEASRPDRGPEDLPRTRRLRAGEWARRRLGREPKPGAPDRRWDSQPLSAELPWMAALLCHAAGAAYPPIPPLPRCTAPSSLPLNHWSSHFGEFRRFLPHFPSCSTRRSMFHVKRRDPAVALPYVHVDVVTGAQSGAAPDRDSETRARLGPPGVRQRQAVTVPGPHAHGALRGPPRTN
jgi:hypothetical protein